MILRIKRAIAERRFWTAYLFAMCGLLASGRRDTYEQIATEASRHARAATYELAKERGEVH